MQKQKKQTHIKHFVADYGLSFATCNISSLYRQQKRETRV